MEDFWKKDKKDGKAKKIMPNGDIFEIIYKNDEDVKLLEKSIVNNNNDYFMKNTSLLKSTELEKFRGIDMRFFSLKII